MCKASSAAGRNTQVRDRGGMGLGLTTERDGEAADYTIQRNLLQPYCLSSLAAPARTFSISKKIPRVALSCIHTVPCTPRIIGSSPSQILIKVSQELNFTEHCVNFPGIANHVASR